MKKFFLLFCAVFLMILGTSAQTLKVKKFKFEPRNAEASKNKVKDSNDENCALILVDVVGVGNIKFDQAVGETKYALNEYKVYVPKNTKRLSYSYGYKKGVVNLEKYGIDIESLQTYRLTMETENKMRSAVFYIQPQNASLMFDGQSVSLDENGAVAIDKPIGTYTYSISANGYEGKTGKITLTEDEINHTESIELQQKMHFVALNCPIQDATLFIDNAPLGTISELGSRIQLAEGKHSYRITCNEYEPANGEISVLDDNAAINANLTKLKGKTIKHKELRTKTEINFRNTFDVTLSGSTFMEDAFKSYLLQLEFAWNQHIFGIFTLREGLSGGFGYTSNKYSPTFDKYYDDQTDEDKHDGMPLTFQAPIQAGVTVPFSKNGRNYVEFLGGVYGAYYYTGHKASHLEGSYSNSVATDTWDWGLRFNALFYINKFILGFEGSKSLYNHDIGIQLGVKIGYKVAL